MRSQIVIACVVAERGKVPAAATHITNLRQVASRQERTWGPDNSVTVEGFAARFQPLDALAGKLIDLPPKHRFEATPTTSIGTADFLDPVLVKVVRLDAACRLQQVHDGAFERIEDVPTHAYTLTVPALLAAPVVVAAVPGPRKAEAVLNTLRGPIAESCPASALRRHAGAVLCLDRDSARLVL